ncbi:MAG TPA: hypothetical protein VMM12_13895 [Longimicrobiales bacterium]|nr:hypothetical protein [Longimicrobiales bacterium]
MTTPRVDVEALVAEDAIRQQAVNTRVMLANRDPAGGDCDGVDWVRRRRKAVIDATAAVV